MPLLGRGEGRGIVNSSSELKGDQVLSGRGGNRPTSHHICKRKKEEGAVPTLPSATNLGRGRNLCQTAWLGEEEEVFFAIAVFIMEKGRGRSVYAVNLRCKMPVKGSPWGGGKTWAIWLSTAFKEEEKGQVVRIEKGRGGKSPFFGKGEGGERETCAPNSSNVQR